MRCPTCGHNVVGNRERCMYCGALAANQIPLDAKDAPNSGKRKVFVEKVEKVLREGRKKVFVEGKTGSYTFPESKSRAPFGRKPVEKILDTLSGIRHQLNDRQIDYSIYRTMVIAVIKDFIDSFHDDLKLNYVVTSHLKNADHGQGQGASR